MSKHTKGPWEAFGPSKGKATIEYQPKYLVMALGEAVDGYAPIPAICDDGSNARLISAAPELLEACKALVACADGKCAALIACSSELSGAVVAARAAIAKAEGGAA